MKTQVAFSDFAKLDLRVGEVVEAKGVEGSEKLVEMTVSFATETRKIYAGINQWYAPEKIQGRKLIFVANLAPKKFKIGDMEYESQGMMVAAGNDEAVLYSFDKDLLAGTIVR